jgi:hypothetical protein
VSGPGLRLGQLADHCFRTINDVLLTTPEQLMAVPCVGAQTATAPHVGARHIWESIATDAPFRFDPDQRTPAATALLQHLSLLDSARSSVGSFEGVPDRIAQELPALIKAARPTASGLRWALTGTANSANSLTALATLTEWLTWADINGAQAKLAAAAHGVPPSSEHMWADFLCQPGRYCALAEQLTGVSSAGHGGGADLPAEITARIEAQHLDTALLRATLRGYQAFGAKFALVQGRSIIGDEMGLGKTMQALAVLCHLSAAGATRFLVVCPASVIYNWQKEVDAHTRLTAVRIHGPGALDSAREWQTLGGIGVTTFDTLKRLTPPNGGLHAIVLDEAHYVKNPDIGRSKAAKAWTAASPRALFLSGTPRENRVDEFVTLVRYLRPEVACHLDTHALAGGRQAFRQEVAPLYLRRNQEEVLGELPDLVRIDE